MISFDQSEARIRILTQPLASPPAPETICTNHSTMHLGEIFRKYSAPPSHESERAMRWEEVQTEFSKGDSQHTSQSRFRNIIDVVKIQGSFFTFFKFWNKLEKHFSLLVWDKGVIVLMAADSAVSVIFLTHTIIQNIWTIQLHFCFMCQGMCQISLSRCQASIFLPLTQKVGEALGTEYWTERVSAETHQLIQCSLSIILYNYKIH